MGFINTVVENDTNYSIQDSRIADITSATPGQVLTIASDSNGNIVQALDPFGTKVEANPTLSGSESDLTSIKIGPTKYKLPSGGSGSPSGYEIPATATVNMETGAITYSCNVTYAQVNTAYATYKNNMYVKLTYSVPDVMKLMDMYVPLVSFHDTGEGFRFMKSEITISQQNCVSEQVLNIYLNDDDEWSFEGPEDLEGNIMVSPNPSTTSSSPTLNSIQIGTQAYNIPSGGSSTPDPALESAKATNGIGYVVPATVYAEWSTLPETPVVIEEENYYKIADQPVANLPLGEEEEDWKYYARVRYGGDITVTSGLITETEQYISVYYGIIYKIKTPNTTVNHGQGISITFANVGLYAVSTGLDNHEYHLQPSITVGANQFKWDDFNADSTVTVTGIPTGMSVEVKCYSTTFNENLIGSTLNVLTDSMTFIEQLEGYQEIYCSQNEDYCGYNVLADNTDVYGTVLNKGLYFKEGGETERYCKFYSNERTSKISHSYINSSGATNGQVLTADGNGNVSWQNGGGSSSIFEINVTVTREQGKEEPTVVSDKTFNEINTVFATYKNKMQINCTVIDEDSEYTNYATLLFDPSNSVPGSMYAFGIRGVNPILNYSEIKESMWMIAFVSDLEAPIFMGSEEPVFSFDTNNSDLVESLKIGVGSSHRILPAPPTTDGNYVLSCNISGQNVSYSWIAQS